MSESTRKKVIAGVLIVAVIWGYFNLRPAAKDKPVASRPSAAAVVPNPTPQVQAPPAPKLVNIEDKSKEPWGTDPFRVTRKAGNTDPTPYKARKWLLSGILYNAHSPAAVINKKHVTIGDIVDDAKVLKIDKKAVTLEHNGSKMTITVTKG